MRKLSEISPSEPISLRDIISLLLSRPNYSSSEYKKYKKVLFSLNEKKQFLFRAPTKKSKIYTTLAALKKTQLDLFFEESDLVTENIELRKKVAELESENNKLRNCHR